MIKIDRVEVFGWEAAIRGLRNSFNSWDKSDSGNGCNIEKTLLCEKCKKYYESYCALEYSFQVGPEDLSLMKKLAKAGSSHAKFRRFINVTFDLIAPLYYWKQFDQYKIGVTTNSTSTMHSIQKKLFEISDFSYENLSSYEQEEDDGSYVGDIVEDYNAIYPKEILEYIIKSLNKNRALYLASKDKRYWWNIIQLLPSSYNQLRTVQLNYEVLSAIYNQRKGHRLDEWNSFCEWIETLPYSELIMLGGK